MRKWTLYINGKGWLVTNWHLVIVGVFVGGAVTYSTFTVSRAVTSNIQAKKFTQETQYAQELNLALNNLRNKISLLNKRLDSVVGIDIKSRLAWDLPHISEDLRNLGIGGPALDNSRTYPEISETQRALLNLKNKLEFESQSFQEISTSIERTQKLLFHTPSIWPTFGALTAKFGYRRHPILRHREFHKGIDIAKRTGTPIVATAAGIVKYISRTKGLGLILEIDHGFGYTTRYGHLSRVAVRPYEEVARSQIIAWMGNSGISTGPHLHYEVKVLGKAVNPLDYIISGTNTY